jgi:Ser/Thr protein kinase RdoA (MazF antagonist)
MLNLADPENLNSPVTMHKDTTLKLVQQMLTTTPPGFSTADAAQIAGRQYGIRATVSSLVSERDQNFRLDAVDGNRYVLKISNTAEYREVVEFQNQALAHVALKDPSLPLPRVIPGLDGQLHSSVDSHGKKHFIRVYSWLEGVLLDDTAVGTELVNDMGRLLARLGLALSDFDHHGSDPPLLWDMKRAAGLRELLPAIEDQDLLKQIGVTLDRFEMHVLPILNTLRKQVIHNDMNPGNVLVDEEQPDRISGLIDFGDMVKSPLIIDLAVAAAYQLEKGQDPLAGALPMVAGYHAVCPLQRTEMELLADLIRTRLITSLLIASYRVRLFPENRDYLMISFNSARAFLAALEELSAGEALQRIQAACQVR